MSDELIVKRVQAQVGKKDSPNYGQRVFLEFSANKESGGYLLKTPDGEYYAILSQLQEFCAMVDSQSLKEIIRDVVHEELEKVLGTKE
jgi:hypothetical protein